MRKGTLNRVGALLAIALGVGSRTASANTINIVSNAAESTAKLAAFTGSVSYTYSGGVGDLQISLTNTTSPAYQGLNITGFVFNTIDPDSDYILSSFTPDFGFQDLTGGGLLASPYGSYEYGAAIGGKWTGGGSPSDGIKIGETGVFHYQVTGPAASLPSTSAMSFLSEGGHSASAGYTGQFFVVRFRGNNSDKEPVVIDVPDDIPGTPLPAAAWGGLGLLGLTLTRRNRNPIGYP